MLIVKSKPQPFEAYEYKGFSKSLPSDITLIELSKSYVTVATINGNEKAYIGDYIIKDNLGQFFICKKDNLALLFEVTDNIPDLTIEYMRELHKELVSLDIAIERLKKKIHDVNNNKIINKEEMNKYYYLPFMRQQLHHMEYYRVALVNQL